MLYGLLIHKAFGFVSPVLSTTSVKAPNSLWHIDSYYKLVRWKIVIHGAIDGFSRIIVYLRVANNNCADTVFAAFRHGVSEYGLPS